MFLISFAFLIYPKDFSYCFRSSYAFPNAKKTERDKIYYDNQWQGSRNRQITFWLDTGIASVHCNDYSKKHGGQDHLAVNLRTNQSNEFLINEAYK